MRLQRQQNPDGRMPLFDHLRELRNRVVKMAQLVLNGPLDAFYLRVKVAAWWPGDAGPPAGEKPAGANPVPPAGPEAPGIRSGRHRRG